MASFTIQAAPHFPVGTEVRVWEGEVPKNGGAPGGTVKDTETVPASGTVTFSGLTDNTKHVVYAAVGGAPRYMEFTTGTFDKLTYHDTGGAEQETDFTAFGRSLLDDVDAAEARSTLGAAATADVATDAELAAEATARAAADSAHEADTTAVHGFADTAEVRQQAGIRDSVIRRGKSIVATEESRTNTAYGLLATPDRVQNVVLPTDGLLFVAYQALWKESVAQAASAAIFIGATQLKRQAGDAAPAVQETFISSGAANRYTTLATSADGLFSHGADTIHASDVTTGQLVFGQGGGGACVVFAAAGTYDISVQFKASSGTVTAKERKLWVWTAGF